MAPRAPSINPTVEVLDAGVLLGPRRAINFGTGLTVSADSAGVVTVDGNAGSSLQPVRIETDDYVVTSEDDGFLLRFQTTDAQNLVVIGAGFDVGFTLDVVFEGVNRLTISGLPGQTVLSRGDRTDLNGQYARARIQNIGENTWLLDGDLVVGPA